MLRCYYKYKCKLDIFLTYMKLKDLKNVAVNLVFFIILSFNIFNAFTY